MATRLMLIRHGSTAWNQSGRYCGFRDIRLNARGKKEARGAHNMLKKEKVYRVYSSDRKRAVETCKIIFRDRATERMPDLREIHFGIFEGLTYPEIMHKYPGFYTRWSRNPFGATIPQGESMADFKKRVVSAFRKILSLNINKTVAVVCHGGTISIFVNSILKKKDFWGYIPKPASLTVVIFKNSKAKIERFSSLSK